MPDIDRAEKLIVTLGQRISEQNKLLRMIATSLQGVESHLRQIAVSSNPAPNYQRNLSEYPTFDWSSIGATVLNRDGGGATSVEWSGQVFTRRSPSNKFQCAICFSRHLGQDSDGNNKVCASDHIPSLERRGADRLQSEEGDPHVMRGAFRIYGHRSRANAYYAY
jgi:DdrB-like protein